MNRRKRILSHYEPRIHPTRASHDILDWASASSQKARFRVLCENVALDGKSLLDVGCGLGDLLGHLTERGISAEYTGLDLSARMLEEASRRHPEGTFVCLDIFGEGGASLPKESYDVVYCSGIFNLNLGNNDGFLPGAVTCLRTVAGETLVFNLLHERARGSDRDYAYYDPQRVLEATDDPGWDALLLDDYLPNDFTVISRRKC